jgi:hypothetical protein
MKTRLEAAEQRSQELTKKVGDLEKKFVASAGGQAVKERTKGVEGRATMPIPETCRDVFNYGHAYTGIYQIVSPSNPNKIQSVFCDFSSIPYGIPPLNSRPSHGPKLFSCQDTQSFQMRW